MTTQLLYYNTRYHDDPSLAANHNFLSPLDTDRPGKIVQLLWLCECVGRRLCRRQLNRVQKQLNILFVKVTASSKNVNKP